MSERPQPGKSDAIDRIVIVGGGTAGWMAAAAISQFFGNRHRTITLIESEEIGTVGVGEATVPPIRSFNAMLGIPEEEFLRETRGTIKLGIEFVNWGRLGDRYVHPFGAHGQDFHGIPFHQIWMYDKAHGGSGDLTDYSMCSVAARAGRFAMPEAGEQSPLAHIDHAYHFDAGLYAAYLRRRAEYQGVVRREGRVVQVHQDGENGDVTAVQLEDGARIEGELFFDCSGFRGLLIEETLKTGYEPWDRWLPMDSALAMPTANVGPPAPYTRATAHTAGWQWRIPLQHRTGNGHVFCSRYMDAGEAERILRENAEGEVLAEPRLLRFTTGMRKNSWNRNVVALGLASGFLEPLESTSIHLVQHGIARFVALFPNKDIDPAERDEYNRNLRSVYEYVRDFVILHYKATRRDDSDFWRRVRAMEVPDSLRHRLELWSAHGRIFPKEGDMFLTPSWAAVLFGQGFWPRHYDPVADNLNVDHVRATLKNMREAYRQTAARLPTHQEFLQNIGAWIASPE
jgi:tryptophan halogenase